MDFNRSLPLFAQFTLVACLASPTVTASARDVDMAIVIMIDVSGSIDQIELATQSQGWADALTELANDGLFTSGPNGASLIHVNFWSDIPWPSWDLDVVDSPSDIIPIADMIRNWHSTFGLTNPAAAIHYARGTLERAELFDIHSSRKLILVSGDGVSNVPPDYGPIDTAAARDYALANGVDQINGLYILGDPQEPPAELRRFYVNEVVGGDGGFATSVQTGHTDLEKFKEAIIGNLRFALAPTVYLPPEDIIYPTAGDFDGDGDVDGRDFLAWQRNRQLGSLADWQANYGTAPPSAAVASVPEPPVGVILMGFATTSTYVRCSRSRKGRS